MSDQPTDTDETRRPPGRPAIPLDMDRLRDMARNHLSQADAAALLGMSEATLSLRLTDPEVRAVWDEGRAEAIDVTVGKLRQRIEEGEITAIKYFLGTQRPEQWSEKRSIELAGKLGFDHKVELSNDEIESELRRRGIDPEEVELR